MRQPNAARIADQIELLLATEGTPRRVTAHQVTPATVHVVLPLEVPDHFQAQPHLLADEAIVMLTGVPYLYFQRGCGLTTLVLTSDKDVFDQCSRARA